MRQAAQRDYPDVARADPRHEAGGEILIAQHSVQRHHSAWWNHPAHAAINDGGEVREHAAKVTWRHAPNGRHRAHQIGHPAVEILAMSLPFRQCRSATDESPAEAALCCRWWLPGNAQYGA